MLDVSHVGGTYAIVTGVYHARFMGYQLKSMHVYRRGGEV